MRTRPASVKGYGVAVLLVAASCLINIALSAYLHNSYFMIYLAAVILAAFYGGGGPALLAGALSAVKIAYFHLEPFYSFSILSTDGKVQMGLFLILSGLVYEAGRRLQSAYADTAEALRDSAFLHRRNRDILAIVSHDLRNPLTSIILNANLLKRESAKNGFRTRAEKQAELIHSSGQKINLLIDELLRLGKIDAGTLSLNAENCHIALLLEDTVNQMRPFAEMKNVHMENDVAEDIVQPLADRATLRQAISNLVENAIENSPDGGTVRLSAANHPGGVVLSIRDEGAGMSPEKLAHLFDRDWQAVHSSPGKGLGLYISRGIAEAHGGRISVESSEGHGSTFMLFIPKEAQVKAQGLKAA
jgi:signal transduction histidine kinase